MKRLLSSFRDWVDNRLELIAVKIWSKRLRAEASQYTVILYEYLKSKGIRCYFRAFVKLNDRYHAIVGPPSELHHFSGHHEILLYIRDIFPTGSDAGASCYLATWRVDRFIVLKVNWLGQYIEIPVDMADPECFEKVYELIK